MRRHGLAAGVMLLLAACATVGLLPPEAPRATTIFAVQRGWHTDVCLAAADAGDWVLAMARDYVGARFLCLGFGERQYLGGENCP
jgi:hypothetical protein